MDRTSPPGGLLGDDPVSDEAHDVLARGPFATRVVELVEHVSNETPSAVLALMGPWGSGKTSVLHFARRRFEVGGSWKVVEFNPWMVSDLPTLVQEFFTTLLAALPDDRRGKRLRKKMAGYAKSVAPLAAPFKIVGVSAEQALRSAGDLLNGDQSIEARRRELEEALRDQSRPILLIADDIDRLHPDELTLIFKLVRLVGRLPNVYYLLAFDEQTVLDVLTSTELAGGDRPRALAYLEKMVQVRLDLPPVHPRLAGQLLDQLLDGLIAKHNVTLDDRAEYRLGQAYRTHLATYLREPRQVKRYCAQIEALYPLLAAEVDFVDFAIVTFLRTFHPGVAALLASHKEELTGTALEFGKKPTHEERRETWQARLRSAGLAEADVASVLDLLGQLFLPIRSALERMEYGSSFNPEMRASRRVGSSEYFDRYFHLGIGPDDLPDATIAAALTELLAGTPGDAWGTATSLLPTNAELVLDKLHRLAPATPEAALLLLPPLAAIAADVPDSGLLGRSRIVHHFWVADLLRIAEPPDPEAFVRKLADLSDVRFVADSCARTKRSADKDGVQLGAPFHAISGATIKLLKEDLARQALLSPQETRGVVSLLADWEALEPGCDRRSWMRSTIESGAWPLPDILGIFVPTGTSSTGDGPSQAALGDMELGFLDQVIGIEYVADQLDPSEDLDEDPILREYDVSWESRVRTALRAVSRWAAANRQPEDGNEADSHPTGDE